MVTSATIPTTRPSSISWEGLLRTSKVSFWFWKLMKWKKGERWQIVAEIESLFGINNNNNRNSSSSSSNQRSGTVHHRPTPQQQQQQKNFLGTFGKTLKPHVKEKAIYSLLHIPPFFLALSRFLWVRNITCNSGLFLSMLCEHDLLRQLFFFQKVQSDFQF